MKQQSAVGYGGMQVGKAGGKGDRKDICRARADSCVAEGAGEQMQWKPR